MNKRIAIALAGAMVLSVSSALAQEPSSPPAAATPATAAGPAVRHLVYRFGYNEKAMDQGPGTGNTTIDIVGPANDGGMTVTATDDWWNSVKPRQSYTCEVYPNGGVTCAQPPYAVSPIQIAILPMLGQGYFTALSSGPSANWKQSYNVRATFFPSAAVGFAGQVYTWNCAYTLTGKGTMPNDAPLILVRSEGSMKQQGGRQITVNQTANMAYDPRINVPVFIDEAISFVPRLSVNQYTVQLRLTGTK